MRRAPEPRRTGPPRPLLVRRYDSLRARLSARMAAVDSTTLASGDARALGVMRRTLARDLGAAPAPDTTSSAHASGCGYDPTSVDRRADSLRARIYACYGWAQAHIPVDGDTVDRLTLLGGIGRSEDPEQRRHGFLALAPVWRSMNGDNDARAPTAGSSLSRPGGAEERELPAEAQARATGMQPDSLERWLVAILETWRDVSSPSLVEPWDSYCRTGLGSRVLSPRIPLERLTRLNDSVYRALGADLAVLRVRYDLAARDGKTPVAFTTFGGRRPIVPWVFATSAPAGWIT